MVCSKCGMSVHERCVERVEEEKIAEIERLKEALQQQTRITPQQEPPSPSPSPAAAAVAPKKNPPLKRAASMMRIVISGNEAMAGDSKLQRTGDIVQFYESGYNRPTLLQALKEAAIDEAETVAKMCQIPALRAEEEGALCGTPLRAEEAAAVTLWTFSFGESETSSSATHSNGSTMRLWSGVQWSCTSVVG